MEEHRENLTVIDFFCGAGGFSEGFKQQGFKIVCGVDSWQPATDTFNHNFKLNNTTQDITQLGEKLELIEKLPDTAIIIGSPPCVSFSNSNKSGNADKSLGVQLIEIFLKIVAVKKHQPNSNLKAWFMENVTNSIKYTQDKYTFNDLQLKNWAEQNSIDPNNIAIDFKTNNRILNSANFGVAQSRKRMFAGEIIKTKSFPKLETYHQQKSIKKIFEYFPKPLEEKNQITDPNYKNLTINKKRLTDHFYDTGIYKAHWEYSQYCKTNHPYMGKMSFPENQEKPSRTITATKLDSSREAIIYKSEIIRFGNGEYRTLTIREAGILMSFPITYQFIGTSETSKWRLVGNAVCPLESSALAKATLRALDLPVLDIPIIEKEPNLEGVCNLNTFKNKIFNNPPSRKKDARFRRHCFKHGNITVALSNYCLRENGKCDKKWRTTITYGTGENYKLQEVGSEELPKIQTFIKTLEKGKEFIKKVQDDFIQKIACGDDLQHKYEKNYSNEKLNPIDLIIEATNLVNCYASERVLDVDDIFNYKSRVHEKQIFALYLITCIIKIATQKN